MSAVIHDFEAHKQLLQLIDKLTTARGRVASHVITNPDPYLVDELKRACRASNTTITTVFDLLYDRLKKQNSQVRLLALEVSAILFQRSRHFRHLFTSKFTHILSLIIGLKSYNTLPDPQNAAACLRQRGLQLLQSWNASYGSRYHQISLGYSYIKNTLKIPFVDNDDGVGGGGHGGNGNTNTTNTTNTNNEREQLERRAHQRQYDQLVDGWDAQQAEYVLYLRQFNEAFELFEQQEESLIALLMMNTTNTSSNVDNTTIDNDIEWQDVDDDNTTNTDNKLASAALLLESLTDAYKSISTTALPQLQHALRVMVRADVGNPGDLHHTQREQLLRTATDLKSQLTAAKERYDARHLDVIAMVQAQSRRMQHDNKNDKNDSGDNGDKNDSKDNNITTTNTNNDIDNPYRYIRDPTLPHRPGPYTVSQQQNNTNKIINTTMNTTINTTNNTPNTNNTTTTTTTSTLPQSIKESLIAKAPVLPVGSFVRVWDSHAPPVYMNNTGMEVSNHWGPVDVHQELPSHRMDELFLYQPSMKLVNRNSNNGNGNGSGSNTVRSNNINTMKIADRVALMGNKTTDTVNAASFAMRLGHADSQRAQRAMERQYNDAVISSAAGGDEALARLMTEENDDTTNDDKNKNGRKKREKKQQLSSRDRLKRRLLSGKAISTAREDAMVTEEDTRRDRFGNKWENK